jgi:hypothetical protein
MRHRSKKPTLVEALGLDLEKLYAGLRVPLTPETFRRHLDEYLEQEGCETKVPPALREDLYAEAVHCGKIVAVCEKVKSIIKTDDFVLCAKQTKQLVAELTTSLRVATYPGLQNARQLPLSDVLSSWTTASLDTLKHELEEADTAIKRAREFKHMGRLEIESLLLLQVDGWLKHTLRGTDWERRRGKLRAAFAYPSQLLPRANVAGVVAMRISRAKTAKTVGRIDQSLVFRF